MIQNVLGKGFVILIFVIFFLGPLVSTIGGTFGGAIVSAAIVPIIIFVVIIVIIFNVIKNLPKTFENMSKLSDQQVEIPIEFFEQGPPALGTSSNNLFNDRYGRTILYYENGKPVFERHES